MTQALAPPWLENEARNPNKENKVGRSLYEVYGAFLSVIASDNNRLLYALPITNIKCMLGNVE
jgi:hypothetical protein